MEERALDVSGEGLLWMLGRAAEQCTNPGEKLRLRIAAGLIPYAYEMLQGQSEPGTFFVMYATTKHAQESLAGRHFDVIKFSKSIILFPELDYKTHRVLVVRIQDDPGKDLEMRFPIGDQSVILRCEEIKKFETDMGLNKPSERFLAGSLDQMQGFVHHA
jgi:hypothetical protein